VNQHHHVVARARLGHHGRQIACHERRLPQEREPLVPEEPLQAGR